jgi:glutamate carboxypeptidase
MSEVHPADLLAKAREKQPALVEFLKELVLIESPSDDPESQQEVQRVLAAGLGEAGYEVRRIPGRVTGGHLYARPAKRLRGRPGQILIGHCDTVWPVGTLGEMPVHEDDGRLTGPGVYDMKAGLAQIVFALQILSELRVEPMVTPLVLVNSDEEIGSPESRGHIRLIARRATRAFIVEPALGLSGKLKTARKGGGGFRVRIRGKAAHAGLDPESGASAILELSHVIQTLHSLNDRQRGISVNVGVIDGGLRPNVVAPEAHAKVDVRVLTLEDAREIESRIRNLQPVVPGVSLEIEGHVRRPPLEPTPRNQALWRAALQAGQELGLELESATAGGGSDGNLTSQFVATLDGLGAVGDGAHARHEFVVLDRLAERTALLARLLSLPAEVPAV